MKKFLAVILCFVYVVTSSGATINFHYCMGKFIGWNIASPLPAECTNCGMTKEKKKGCCNEKQETFQLRKEQLVSSVNDVPNNNFVYIYHQYPSSINSIINIYDDKCQLIRSPPLINPVPASILNCVFRI